MESKVEKVKVVLKKSLKILSLAPDLVCLYFDGPHKESLIGIWEKNREKTKGKVDHLSEIHQIHDLFTRTFFAFFIRAFSQKIKQNQQNKTKESRIVTYIRPI